MKENIRPYDFGVLLLNSVLATIVLIILITALGSLGLITYTITEIVISTALFIVIAFLNLFIRIAESSRLGYYYYYEHSFAYAILSFIVNARFYGFFPVLYLGGSRIAVNRIGRVGFDDIGTNQADLYDIAVLPLSVNIAVCLALIPAAVQTNSWFVRTLGFLLASYTFFSLIPWPYSNGLHILAYDGQRWTTYITIATALLLFYTVI